MKTYYEDCPNCGRQTSCVLYGRVSAIADKLNDLKQKFDNDEILCFKCGAPLKLVEKGGLRENE